MKRRLAYAVLVAVAAAIVAFAPLPAMSGTNPSRHTVRIEASQFSYSPSIVSVERGDTVTLELISTDVVHGLYVDGYGVSVQADPGQTKSVTFVADQPGSFRFRCNVTCGAMHPFMIGKLQVGQNTAFLRSAGFLLVGTIGVLLFRKSSVPDPSAP